MLFPTFSRVQIELSSSPLFRTFSAGSIDTHKGLDAAENISFSWPDFPKNPLQALVSAIQPEVREEQRNLSLFVFYLVQYRLYYAYVVAL